MASLNAVWHRVPVLVRAVVVGMLAAAAGSFPWAALAGENLRHLPAVPWGPAIMLGYLWVYWRYAGGRGWPATTAEARRSSLRARPLTGAVWVPALVAGLLGLWAIVAGMRLLGRVVALPHESAGDLSGIPPLTLLIFVLMSALVAGVVEETSFRGYMQRPIERRHGPVVAIVVVGLMFGLAHTTHAYWSLVLMPYYVAAAAVYGGLAYLTDSILPSLVLHTGGDALSALLLVFGNRGLMDPGTARSAGPGGVNGAFWVNAVVFVVVAGAAVPAYRWLARVVRSERRDASAVT